MCMQVSVGALRGQKRVTDSSIGGVTGGCEPSVMGTGNQTPVRS